MKEEDRKYRDLLLTTDQKSQESYDKTVLYLSAGGIGVSLAFVRDLAGTKQIEHPCFLITAWLLWGMSLTAVLVSMYTSHLAMRQTLRDLDAGKETAPGTFDTFTTALNVSAGLLFILGLLAIGLFAAFTLVGGSMTDSKKTAIVQPTRTAIVEPTEKKGLNVPPREPKLDGPAPTEADKK